MTTTYCPIIVAVDSAL